MVLFNKLDNSKALLYYLLNKAVYKRGENMTLGALIKQYRRQNNISMDEFSISSGLSKGYISMLEKNINPTNGKSITPSLETIKQAATAMGIDLTSILEMIDQEISLQTANKTDGHKYQNIIYNLDKLNNVGVQKVEAYAQDLVDTGLYNHCSGND